MNGYSNIYESALSFQCTRVFFFNIDKLFLVNYSFITLLVPQLSIVNPDQIKS